MSRTVSLATALTLPLLLALPAAGPAAAATAGSSEPGMEVGRIGDLDLAEVRRIIETAHPTDPGISPSRYSRTLTLDEALRVALEHNLQIQIQSLNRDVAEREIPATKAKFHPLPGFQLLATGTNTRDGGLKGAEQFNDNSYSGRTFVNQQIPTGASLTLASDLNRDTSDSTPGNDDTTGGVTIELTQPLMRGGRVYVARRAILDAEYDLEIQEAILQAEILRVVADTKTAYFDAIFRQRNIEVTEAAIERGRELTEASQALFAAGRSNQRDVVSAEISLAEDQTTLAVRRGEAELAQNRLRDVLGLPIDTNIVLGDRYLPFQPVEIRLDDWIATALANRPELLQIKSQLDKAALEVRVRGNDVLPQLDLRGLYRRDQAVTRTSSPWFDLDGEVWETGLNFSIPFGNVAARERLTEAEIVHARLERQYVFQERQVELEVRESVIVLNTSLTSLKPITAQVEQSREKLEIARVRFQLGLANNLDITDAQTDLRDAEDQLLEAITAYAIALAELEARIASSI